MRVVVTDDDDGNDASLVSRQCEESLLEEIRWLARAGRRLTHQKGLVGTVDVNSTVSVVGRLSTACPTFMRSRALTALLGEELDALQEATSSS
jgi:hypothetical protein